MKIGILYICTGNYNIFWHNFYKSCEKYFMVNDEKHYYVFTDDQTIVDTDRIHITPKQPLGFPLDSLLRFDMFLSIKDKLEEMDYIYFFNSNMEFVDFVDKELIPNKELKHQLLAVLSPGYYNTPEQYLPYERNKKSTAYIPYNKTIDYHYLMGGVNGGKTSEFLELCKVCSENIKKDLDNNIIARYHDESQINKYLYDKEITFLSPAYGYPEGSKIPFEPKIVIGNKIRIGGKYFDKLPKNSYIKRIKLFIKKIYYALIWKLQ